MTQANAGPPQHLVSVWNPLYSSDVDQHFGVLLAWAQKAREKKADDADVYVWWGKVKSPNRLQPMARADDLRALAKRLEADDATETHIYLTDYRHLYVGRLWEISEQDEAQADADHVPAYYRQRGLKCDFWFMLGDVRRLVADDLPGVAEELHRLKNVHYHDKPVSLYGGMVDLPLFVVREDHVTFFDDDERIAIAGDRMWVEYDRDMGGSVAAVQRDLRNNVIGEHAWSALESSARSSLAAAERMFRDHRGEPAFDFAPVLVAFAKAMEVQCNAVLRAAAAKLAQPQRLVNIDGRSVDLSRTRALTLGQLARVIGEDQGRNKALASALENGAWFAMSLPPVLSDLAEIRNKAAHNEAVGSDVATSWRNQILGVGSKGHLVDLAQVRLKRA